MDRGFEEIVEEALSLDTEHRGELAEKLFESLAPDDRIMDEWLGEAERRKKEWDAGMVDGVEAEEALRQLKSITS